jgi:hypothetical protein
VRVVQRAENDRAVKNRSDEPIAGILPGVRPRTRAEARDEQSAVNHSNIVEMVKISPLGFGVGLPHDLLRLHSALPVEAESKQLVGSRRDGVQTPIVCADGVNIPTEREDMSPPFEQRVVIECTQFRVLRLIWGWPTTVEHRIHRRG